MMQVLTYHRVAPVEKEWMLHAGLLSSTPEVFDRQCEHLARNYRVITMSEALDFYCRGTSLPKNAVLLTFDDGYRDFAEYAWPVLKKYSLPATLFVATAFPGVPDAAFWWDRLYRAIMFSKLRELQLQGSKTFELSTREQRSKALRELDKKIKSLPHRDGMLLVDEICEAAQTDECLYDSLLNWDELRSLAGEGVTIGAHSRNHPILANLTSDEIREELAGSQEDVQREIGFALPIFCYPAGAYNEDSVCILREHGFALAFTTRAGNNNLHLDPLQLRRTNISLRTSPAIFKLRLLHWFNHIDSWRQRVQTIAAA